MAMPMTTNLHKHEEEEQRNNPNIFNKNNSQIHQISQMREELESLADPCTFERTNVDTFRTKLIQCLQRIPSLSRTHQHRSDDNNCNRNNAHLNIRPNANISKMDPAIVAKCLFGKGGGIPWKRLAQHHDTRCNTSSVTTTTLHHPSTQTSSSSSSSSSIKKKKISEFELLAKRSAYELVLQILVDPTVLPPCCSAVLLVGLVRLYAFLPHSSSTSSTTSSSSSSIRLQSNSSELILQSTILQILQTRPLPSTIFVQTLLPQLLSCTILRTSLLQQMRQSIYSPPPYSRDGLQGQFNRNVDLQHRYDPKPSRAILPFLFKLINTLGDSASDLVSTVGLVSLRCCLDLLRQLDDFDIEGLSLSDGIGVGIHGRVDGKMGIRHRGSGDKNGGMCPHCSIHDNNTPILKRRKRPRTLQLSELHDTAGTSAVPTSTSTSTPHSTEDAIVNQYANTKSNDDANADMEYGNQLADPNVSSTCLEVENDTCANCTAILTSCSTHTPFPPPPAAAATTPTWNATTRGNDRITSLDLDAVILRSDLYQFILDTATILARYHDRRQQQTLLVQNETHHNDDPVNTTATTTTTATAASIPPPFYRLVIDTMIRYPHSPSMRICSIMVTDVLQNRLIGGCTQTQQLDSGYVVLLTRLWNAFLGYWHSTKSKNEQYQNGNGMMLGGAVGGDATHVGIDVGNDGGVVVGGGGIWSMDKGIVVLRAYCEIVAECCAFDDPELCWMGVQRPLLHVLRLNRVSYLGHKLGHDGDEDVGNCNDNGKRNDNGKNNDNVNNDNDNDNNNNDTMIQTILPSVGNLLVKRRNTLLDASVSAELRMAINGVLAQTSEAFGRQSFWMRPDMSRPDRKELTSTLQLFGILGLFDGLEEDGEEDEQQQQKEKEKQLESRYSTSLWNERHWPFPTHLSLRKAIRRMGPKVRYPRMLVDPRRTKPYTTAKSSLSSSSLSLPSSAPVTRNSVTITTLSKRKRERDDSMSGEPILEYLNEDTVRYIFEYLGYKKLVRVTGVCKLWNTIGNENYFWSKFYARRFKTVFELDLLPEDEVKDVEPCIREAYVQRFSIGRDIKGHEWRKLYDTKRIAERRARAVFARTCNVVGCLVVKKKKEEIEKHICTHIRQVKKRLKVVISVEKRLRGESKQNTKKRKQKKR